MNEKVTNAKVDTFINNLEQWQDEFKFLRKLSLDTELEEEFKWKHPCYTLNDKNVVIIKILSIIAHCYLKRCDNERQI